MGARWCSAGTEHELLLTGLGRPWQVKLYIFTHWNKEERYIHVCPLLHFKELYHIYNFKDLFLTNFRFVEAPGRIIKMARLSLFLKQYCSKVGEGRRKKKLNIALMHSDCTLIVLYYEDLNT